MRNVSKVLAIMLLLFIGFNTQPAKAQEKTLSNNPDPRLYEAFGKERVDFLIKNNPDLIGYYNFFLDNAFVMVQHQSEKIPGIISNCPILEVISPDFIIEKPDMTKGTKSINILKYKYQIEQDKTTQYRLDNSGIIIVFYPATIITEKYNKARNL
jgi:hypothetical protein